ncbi:MAG: mechanosensitive ion channel family protein [Actinomycetia bacterium]|nr:mechanosensitive ion channel family protein [Actinomycetes bacterium]MCH9700680.1 mechanosensitive ion channel family protein [Actinomycetes bacterium]MCH9760821.1 mechanosensitive ion channel family protein [Actinomycetes bacterium]
MSKGEKLESATDLALTAICAVLAIAVAYAAGMLLFWLLRRLSRRRSVSREVLQQARPAVLASLMVAAATVAVYQTSDPAEDAWRGWVDHALLILEIATLTWLAISLLKVLERRTIASFGGGDAEIAHCDRRLRRVRTQVTVLQRLATAVVVVLGLAVILMTFPGLSNIGTTLFASAGVLSVVAGLAAQTSLGAVFAGLQIAFSGAIRVGDVVVLEDEWGHIEEITLTYVVVKIWDQRRLVLPSTYFTTKPFENWTRNATELLGTVEFDVDFTVSLDQMRAEVDRLLATSDLWDGRSSMVQVIDAVGGCVRVRILVSAHDSGALFDLRCAVREGMLAWLQRTQSALPRYRIGSADATGRFLESLDDEASWDDHRLARTTPR